MKNLLDVCTGAIGFYVIGYGLAFGDKVDPGTGLTEGNGFIGTRYFALEGLAHTARDHWMFMYGASWDLPLFIGPERIIKC